MAADFEHVKFYGLDMGMVSSKHTRLLSSDKVQVPIATRFPAANVQFEVHDVMTPLRWREDIIDLVHIKHASLGVRATNSYLLPVV